MPPLAELGTKAAPQKNSFAHAREHTFNISSQEAEAGVSL